MPFLCELLSIPENSSVLPKKDDFLKEDFPTNSVGVGRVGGDLIYPASELFAQR